MNVGPSAPASPASRSGWPFLVVAGGGALVAAGGLAMSVLFASGQGNPYITTGAFVLGGILLAAGWGFLIPRGDAGFGPVIGSLALSACWIIGAFLDLGGGPGEQVVKGMLGTAGLLACAASHLNTLEMLGLDGARLAALVATIGFGLELAAVSKKLPLPDVVQTVLMWIGMVGTVLFGIVLMIGAGSRGAGSKSRSAAA